MPHPRFVDTLKRLEGVNYTRQQLLPSVLKQVLREWLASFDEWFPGNLGPDFDRTPPSYII